MVSGSISLPYSGFFSPFPHGTSSLSVSQEYLALPDGPAQIRARFPVPRTTQDTTIDNFLYLYGTITRYGSTFQRIPIHQASNVVVLQPQYCRNNTGLGYPRSLALLTESLLFLFLQVLRCFSSLSLLSDKPE